VWSTAARMSHSICCTLSCRYHLYLIGTRMRNSLMAAIYRKCLRLSNSSMQQESTGKVVTVSW
jgi:ATP-binding cassette subfamily C (CFTR/MRP) protein 1